MVAKQVGIVARECKQNKMHAKTGRDETSINFGFTVPLVIIILVGLVAQECKKKEMHASTDTDVTNTIILFAAVGVCECRRWIAVAMIS